MRRLRVAAAVAILALAGLLACASSTAAPPKRAADDPAERLIASLTEALKLDAAQQQKTRELLKEMADRDDRIRAGWAKGERVRPELLAVSHGQFEHDFAAILSEEQRKIYVENKRRLMLRSRGVRSSLTLSRDDDHAVAAGALSPAGPTRSIPLGNKS